MRRRPTNIEGLCDALNAVGIRATVVGHTEAKPNRFHTSRAIEKARRKSLKEIARIVGRAKRLASK